MLSPYDYGYDALHDPETKGFMEKITFEHGGAESAASARFPCTFRNTLKRTLELIENRTKLLEAF